jgi:hypothetical protein
MAFVKEAEQIIYMDPEFYAHNPSLVHLQNGDLVVGFRRAPQRKPATGHIDGESEAVLVRSRDGGKTWGKPELIYKQEYGVQDPSLAQLRDGTIICNFFQWKVMYKEPWHHEPVSTGLVRSFDNAATWEKTPVYPEVIGYLFHGPTEPVLQLPDGDLLMPLYGNRVGGYYEAFVIRSRDNGINWTDPVLLGTDPFQNVLFEEPSLCLAKSGKILAVMRDDRFGYFMQTYSTDGGKTWAFPRRLDIWGCPANLLTLSDGRILMTYGYRRPPYSVRGCISEDEGNTWNLGDELIFRSDGLHGDLGYPSSIELASGRVMTSYYFHTGRLTNKDDASLFTRIPGTRYIACKVYSI